MKIIDSASPSFGEASPRFSELALKFSELAPNLGEAGSMNVIPGMILHSNDNGSILPAEGSCSGRK